MSDQQGVEKEDRELVQRMASKDAAALDAFYQRYNRIAFSLILRIVGNREDSEDVLTDVFWQVWQQAPRYDASRGKPIAWLLTIARTRAIAAGRERSLRPCRYSKRGQGSFARADGTAENPIGNGILSGDEPHRDRHSARATSWNS